MNGRILVCCASRDRNLALDGMIRSVEATTTLADIAVYVDDDQGGDYAEILPRVQGVVGPRIGPCASLNHLVAANPGYDVYGAATDDCQFCTPGWDRWVLRQGARLGVGAIAPYNASAPSQEILGRTRLDFPFVTGRWVAALGFLCPPTLHHFYWDVVLEVMAESVGIAYASKHDCEIRHDDAGTQYDVSSDARLAMALVAFQRVPWTAKLKAAKKAFVDEGMEFA